VNGNEQLILQGGALAVVLALFYSTVRWMMQRLEQQNGDLKALMDQFVETVRNHIARSTEAQIELKEAIRELTRELQNGRRVSL
jgi:hypothetical protein